MRSSALSENMLAAAAVTALLCLVCAWLLAHGYVSEQSLFHWARVTAVLDSESLRLEHFGLVYPHLPFYLLVPFHLVWPTHGGASPYLLSALTVSLLLGLWQRDLARTGRVFWQRAVLLVPVLCHPAVLWAATGGSNLALSMLMFYLLYRACMRMIREEDVQSFILLGLILALYFFADGIALFVMLALIPFLAIIAPPRLLLESPVSVYLIITMPLAIAVGTWTYLNWIYEGDPFHYILASESAFLGGWQETPELTWLRRFGGRILAPIAESVHLVLINFPVVLLVLFLAWRYTTHLRATAVLLFHPLIAIGFATAKFFLAHPFQILPLVMAGLMAELSILPLARPWKIPAVTALLLAGALGGWHTFADSQTPDLQNWYQAAGGHFLGGTHRDERALGVWLGRHRLPTLLDDRNGAAIIVARGDARGLVLPFSDQFKLEIRRRSPRVGQIVVPDPATEGGRRDRINLQFPKLFRAGLAGYRLVYDAMGWRVYRHVDS